MKKLVILICSVFLLAGCTSIKNEDLDVILKDGLSSNVHATNVNREGYKYYLPVGLSVKNSTDYNEILKEGKNEYYLYVDAISYYNKITEDYNISSTSYYSRTITNDNKVGYLEINQDKNGKYLIEIMYNYAKIEVMVDEHDINTSVAYAMSVLSSIVYNDSVLANLVGAGKLDFTEEEFNIFDTVSSDSNYLQLEEEYKYVEEEIPDTDLVK